MTALEEQVTRAFEDARDDVYRYLMTFGLPAPEAQEAAQEVFLRLYLALRKGEVIHNTRAWIFRVAHNLGIDLRAKDHYRPLGADMEAGLLDRGPGAEKELIERERMTRIGDAWKTLSPQQQQCLHLRAEGLRYREIADAMSISISTVRQFLSRGIARLQRAVYE